MKKCAYCKSEQSLTREHVIPAFIYSIQKKTKQKCIGWNDVIEKMIGGEFKVKDVCGKCNNEILGLLDEYAKNTFTESGILVENYISLTYDYNHLTRWLLKVSFNSSRTDGAHAHLFEEYIPFILGYTSAPIRSKVAVIAYMAAPEYVDASRINRESFLKLAKGSKVLNPFIVRICYGVVSGSSNYTLRLNVFGPLVFSILLFNDNVLPGHACVEIKRFLKILPKSVELTVNKKIINLKAGEISWLDLYTPQVMRAKGQLNVVNKAFKQVD